MFIIGTNKVGVRFGENVILENVTFSINQGDKVSIVGVNGAGKSTLMRVFYDKDFAYTGEVFLAKDKTVGFLEQLSTIDPALTVYEAGLRVFRELSAMESRLAALQEELKTDHSDAKIEAYSALEAKFQSLGGYQYQSRVHGTLISMGFEDMLSLPVGSLSGGQKTSLQLALLLLEEPDILLLDEPTNHLDIRALEWLEEKLKQLRSTVLVISHDRFFLDRVTTKTLEIENTHAKLYAVPYTQYREQKKTEREIQERHYKNQQKEIARMEAFIEQQRRWNREKNIVAAESRQKALDRMVKVQKAENLPESLAFQFTGALESGEDVISVKELSKAYGNKVLFEKLSFEVHKKDRLVILGANGSGKSTLLQILAGNTAPSGGEFRFGYNVRMGYYDQYQRLNENGTVLEEIWEDTDLTHTEVRKLLATFLFKGDDVFKEIRVLSGGERARLVLAKLMQKKVNLLLLDEPTNHLDIESREALENALLGFEGTIVAVSHDRYFINKIATSLLEFTGEEALDGNKVKEFKGTYAALLEYREKHKMPEKASGQKKSAAGAGFAEQKRRKQEAQKRQHRIEKIEAEIAAAEERLVQIDNETEEAASDYIRLQALFEEKEALRQKIDALFAEWGELEKE